MDLHPSGLPGLVGPAEVSSIPPPTPTTPTPSPFLPHKHSPSPILSEEAAGSTSVRFLPNNLTTDVHRSDHESVAIARAISHPLHLKPSAAPPPPLAGPPPLPSLRLLVAHPPKPGSLHPPPPPPPLLALDHPTNPLFITPLQPQASAETKPLHALPSHAIPPKVGRESPGAVANRVALEACVQARNEGRDLAREGNEITALKLG